MWLFAAPTTIRASGPPPLQRPEHGLGHAAVARGETGRPFPGHQLDDAAQPVVEQAGEAQLVAHDVVGVGAVVERVEVHRQVGQRGRHRVPVGRVEPGVAALGRRGVLVGVPLDPGDQRVDQRERRRVDGLQPAPHAAQRGQRRGGGPGHVQPDERQRHLAHPAQLRAHLRAAAHPVGEAVAAQRVEVAGAAARPGVDGQALAEPGLHPEGREPAAPDQEPREPVAQQRVLADEVRALADRHTRAPRSRSASGSRSSSGAAGSSVASPAMIIPGP
nr:hypothetical protein [Pseudonocardia lacus]